MNPIEAINIFFRDIGRTEKKSSQAWLEYQTAREIVFTHGAMGVAVLAGLCGGAGAIITLFSGN